MTYSQRLKQKIAEGLEDKVSAFVRQMVTRVQGPVIREMIRKFDRDELRPVKEYAIGHLAELVDRSVARLQDNGFIVFRARTAGEAVDYILKLVQGGVVVKSKSNAVKEIGLVDALVAAGATVVETDLGDRICQMGNIPASHPIGPALHVPVQKVADLFAAETGQPVPPVPEEIVKVARETLRQRFFEAGVGISGANAICADTGSVVVMENEGNIRCVTNLPPVHIIVAGIEKIVPTLEDGIKVARAAGLYGMGLDFATYVSVISGPSRTHTVEGRVVYGLQGPGEVHIVLLEEGRWEAVKEGFAESLYCINCGSCLGRCPVYGELGERYGHKYFGGIGVIHAAFGSGLDKALEAGLPLCLGCRKCVAACPVRIDTPGMIQRLRERAVAEKGLGRGRKMLLGQLLNNGSAIQRIAPVAGGLVCDRDGRGGWYPRYALFGLEKGRRLPELSKKSFLSEAPRRSGKGERKVAYFAGCLNNLIFPRVAGATLRVLRNSGVEVIVPPGQKCCGYPSLANGDRDGAVRNAIANLRAFGDAGVEAVVTDCATCYSGLTGYPELLAGDSRWVDSAREFAGKVKELAQYLVETGFQPAAGETQRKVTYHQPCHLAAHGLSHGRDLLQSVPGLQFASSQLEDNCCGFGGTFNLDFYQLSKTIGAHKIQPIQGSGAAVVVTSCPGCMVQLMDLLGSGGQPQVMHISELLAGGGGQHG